MTNISNLFKFIEDKEGYRTPLKYKLLHDPETITPDDLIVKGNLNLSGNAITSLPDNLKVGGDLNLFNTKITSLPDNLKVGGYLDLRNTPISKKYTKEQLKQMLLGVKGEIIV